MESNKSDPVAGLIIFGLVLLVGIALMSGCNLIVSAVNLFSKFGTTGAAIIGAPLLGVGLVILMFVVSLFAPRDARIDGQLLDLSMIAPEYREDMIK